MRPDYILMVNKSALCMVCDVHMQHLNADIVKKVI